MDCAKTSNTQKCLRCVVSALVCFGPRWVIRASPRAKSSERNWRRPEYRKNRKLNSFPRSSSWNISRCKFLSEVKSEQRRLRFCFQRSLLSFSPRFYRKFPKLSLSVNFIDRIFSMLYGNLNQLTKRFSWKASSNEENFILRKRSWNIFRCD